MQTISIKTNRRENENAKGKRSLLVMFEKRTQSSGVLEKETMRCERMYQMAP